MSVIKWFNGINFLDNSFDLINPSRKKPFIHGKDWELLSTKMGDKFYGGQLKVVEIDLNIGIDLPSDIPPEIGVEYSYGLIPYDKEGNVFNQSEDLWFMLVCPLGNMTRAGSSVEHWTAIECETMEAFKELHGHTGLTPPGQIELFEPAGTGEQSSLTAESIQENSVKINLESLKNKDSVKKLIDLHEKYKELGLTVSYHEFEDALTQSNIQSGLDWKTIELTYYHLFNTKKPKE